MPRYVDPTTDFGFKKLFGEEANKDITLSFLNDVLEPEAPLRDIAFMDKEQLPEASDERRVIYDIFCHDTDGKEYIVEMQKNKIPFIRDRMLYYTTFPIAKQAKKSGEIYGYPSPSFEDLRVRDVTTITYGGKTVKREWKYELKEVYLVAVLDYPFDGSTTAVNRIRLRDDQFPHASFYDKLQFITIELPLFDEHKPEYSLDRRLNKWLYFLKNLRRLDHVPKIFKGDKIFLKAFRVAELARMTPLERHRYEMSLNNLRDLYSFIYGSTIEARIEGKNEGRIEEGRNTLHLLFSKKLGPLPQEIIEAINALNDLDQIHDILARFIEINDWETLRKYLPSPQE
jgi:hypothetical protein